MPLGVKNINAVWGIEPPMNVVAHGDRYSYITFYIGCHAVRVRITRCVPWKIGQHFQRYDVLSVSHCIFQTRIKAAFLIRLEVGEQPKEKHRDRKNYQQ
jgi:hypothetical protein